MAAPDALAEVIEHGRYDDTVIIAGHEKFHIVTPRHVIGCEEPTSLILYRTDMYKRRFLILRSQGIPNIV